MAQDLIKNSTPSELCRVYTVFCFQNCDILKLLLVWATYCIMIVLYHIVGYSAISTPREIFPLWENTRLQWDEKGRPCVNISDHWCSNSVKQDGKYLPPVVVLFIYFIFFESSPVCFPLLFIFIWIQIHNMGYRCRRRCREGLKNMTRAHLQLLSYCNHDYNYDYPIKHCIA